MNGRWVEDKYRVLRNRDNVAVNYNQMVINEIRLLIGYCFDKECRMVYKFEVKGKTYYEFDMIDTSVVLSQYLTLQSLGHDLWSSKDFEDFKKLTIKKVMRYGKEIDFYNKVLNNRKKILPLTIRGKIYEI